MTEIRMAARQHEGGKDKQGCEKVMNPFHG